jgi:hypothetical protein
MAFAPYATLDEFRTWVILKDTDDDAVANSVLTIVTRWIDTYCDRHFWQDGATGSEVARTFVACGTYELDIDDLVSATAVKTDAAGDGTFETTWAASDYQLWPPSQPAGNPYTKVRAVAGQLFPIVYSPFGRADRTQITGIWGWPAVPPEVHQACLMQSSRLLWRRGSPGGIAGFGDFAVRVGTLLDPDVRQLLDPYRRIAVLVA